MSRACVRVSSRIIVLDSLNITGYKKHREEHRRQEHRQPHCHAAGELFDAGPPQVSFFFTHGL